MIWVLGYQREFGEGLEFMSYATAKMASAI